MVKKIFQQSLLKAELSQKEQYWINFFHAYIKDPESNGYNLTRGGEGTILLDYDKIFSLWNQGYNCTEISQMIPCNLGIISPILQNYGITAQEIWHKGRMITGQKKSKAVDMLDINTNKVLMTFPSMTAAANYLQHPNCYTKISLVCQGKRKTAQGYKWRYANKVSDNNV